MTTYFIMEDKMAIAQQKALRKLGFQQWPISIGVSINFSNLALANRVSSGQASSGNFPSPPCVKPRPLPAIFLESGNGYIKKRPNTIYGPNPNR